MKSPHGKPPILDDDGNCAVDTPSTVRQALLPPYSAGGKVWEGVGPTPQMDALAALASIEERLADAVTSERMADALDEAVERMLKVLLRWGEDSRGPGNSWTLGIAEMVEVLVRCRIELGKQAVTQDDEADLRKR
jgi:hypothetical protein